MASYGVDEACTEPTVSGSCLAYFKKFTYDAVKKTCKEFIYGGCGGNSNRFDSLEECQAKCQTNDLDAGPKPVPFDTPGRVRNDICNLPNETGPCRGFFRKYAYNDVSERCEEFVYGGCQGNANRFDTLMDCEKQCLVNEGEDACGLPLVTGPCRGIFKKYGYDTVSKTCKEFIYGGCGGNGNQFDSVEMCEKQCKPMDSCDVVSCIIPIVVIVVIIIIAVIVAVILVQKRRRNSSKKYTPTAAGEPSDASELKKMSPEPENV